LKKRASINDKITNAAFASGTLLFGKEPGDEFVEKTNSATKVG